jgi:hypothetical protein
MCTRLSKQGIWYEWMTLENMAQGFVEQHGIWICSMMVELNQHHNSKVESRVAMYSHHTQITQL